MNKMKNIAIIASAENKTDLIEWSYFNKETLRKHDILALGNAAGILEGTLNKTVNVTDAGKMGEYSALRNMIENDKIDAVIIFNDSEEMMHNKSLLGIIETATRNNIIIATNRTTADFVINSELIDNKYEVLVDEKKTVDKNSFSESRNYLLAS